jgi:hypothetical protein
MAMVSVQGEERGGPELVGRWFRELDQRLIYQGPQEWELQVTSILHEDDIVWIQIADRSRPAGSVLLRVRPTTSVEQAVRMLGSPPRGVASYPRVISAFASQTVV